MCLAAGNSIGHRVDGLNIPKGRIMKNAERRKFPRIKDKEIAVKLSGEGFNTITQSLDVSASGIYCKVDRRIPLMTRVQLALVIPGKTSSHANTLKVEGVVVREHPVINNGKVQHYDVAIFFDSLSPEERRMITQYIETKTSKN